MAKFKQKTKRWHLPFVKKSFATEKEALDYQKKLRRRFYRDMMLKEHGIIIDMRTVK